MTGSPSPRAGAAPGLRDFGPALLAGVVAMFVLFAGAQYFPPGTGGHWNSRLVWTDHQVRVEFLSDHPAVTVGSSTGERGYGLYAGLTTLTEVGPGGNVTAAAVLGPSAWSFTPGSDDGVLDARYTSVAPVTDGHGQTVGSSALSVTFSSGNVGGSVPNDTVVAMGVQVSDWPWRSAEDSLALGVPLWPNNTSLEHVGVHPANGGVQCFPNDGGSAGEFMTWTNGAPHATGPTGAEQVGSVNSSYHGNGSFGILTLTLSGLGGGSSIEFVPQIGVVPVASTPWPWAEYLGVGVVGAGLAGLFVVALRRSWTALPSLEMAPPLDSPPSPPRGP